MTLQQLRDFLETAYFDAWKNRPSYGPIDVWMVMAKALEERLTNLKTDGRG